MSYEVLIKVKDEPEGGHYLGSGTDLMDLSGWVESLPADACPNLRALVLDGGAVDAKAACMEIDPALEDHPPEVKGVAETADRLAEVLDRWPDGTMAIVSDGVNTPDVWWEEEDNETAD